MTPRLRQAQGAQGGDDDLIGEDHPFVHHRATTAAAAPTGANGPNKGNTGIGPMGGEAGGQTRLDLQGDFSEDTAFLSCDDVNEIARHLHPNGTQDAGWHTIAAQHELAALPHIGSSEEYDELEHGSAEQLTRQVLTIEIHIAVLEILGLAMGNSQSVSSSDSEKNAQDCLARLRPKLEENPTWCRLLTAERPMGKIRWWARPAALAEFEGLRQERLARAHSAREVARAETQPTSAGRMYLRTGDQAPAVANFPRSSRVQSPSTEEALVLLTQFDTTRLLTGEDGLTLRSMAHAAIPNAWLSLQYSSWTCTMLQPLRNAGKSEAACVEAFFMHVQKMFNLPNLFRLSLTQLKALRQEDPIAGAAFLLRVSCRRVSRPCNLLITRGGRSGNSQWNRPVVTSFCVVWCQSI